MRNSIRRNPDIHISETKILFKKFQIFQKEEEKMSYTFLFITIYDGGGGVLTLSTAALKSNSITASPRIPEKIVCKSC